jgi:F-type H+-transporting ATPase subunit b
MEILRQLGQMFLGAIPVVILLFLFYLFLRIVFFKPILAAMDERKRRTEGARAEAVAAQQAAAARIAEFEEALRHARAQIYAEQEVRRQAVLDERARMIRDGRAEAHALIHVAKRDLASSLAAARAELESSGPELANEIVHNILSPKPHSQAGKNT